MHWNCCWMARVSLMRDPPHKSTPIMTTSFWFLRDEINRHFLPDFKTTEAKWPSFMRCHKFIRWGKKSRQTNKRKELLDPSTRIVFLVSNLGILEWGHNMDKHSQKSAKKTSNKCNTMMLIAGKKDTADVFLFFKKKCFYGGKRQKKQKRTGKQCN